MTDYQKDFLLELCELLLVRCDAKEAIIIIRPKYSDRLQIIAAPDFLEDEHMIKIFRAINGYVKDNSVNLSTIVTYKNRDGEAEEPRY